jgi:von Willebrand factor type A domain.
MASKKDVCYLLDCSGSMSHMPTEGVELFKQSVKELDELSLLIRRIRIIEFGDTYFSYDFKLKELDTKFRWTSWKSSMGQTALYDAIVFAILSSKNSSSILTIITDGEENSSWSTKESAVKLLKKFRSKDGKVRLIGPGTEDHLMNTLGGEVDSVFPLDPKTTHSDMITCLGSVEYRSNSQSLICD